MNKNMIQTDNKKLFYESYDDILSKSDINLLWEDLTKNILKRK